jgi:hypothetical protein
MAVQSARSKRWRKAVLDQFELNPAEMVLLEEAVAMLAEVDAMEAQLETAEVVTRGSRGQPVVHPLVGELRQHRLALSMLVRRLNLPDSILDEDRRLQRSSMARKAAMVRWHGSGS